MPIPFLLGAAAAAAGLYGVKKGIDAKDNMDTAKRINQNAQETVDETKKNINYARESTNTVIANLGQNKLNIASGTMKSFVDTFSKIEHVDFRNSIGFEELRGFTPNSPEFLNMENTSFKAKELATGASGGLAAGSLAAIGAGSLAAIGAGGLASTIGVASTGTAIGTLSGAAATNATLAWLGGGALSAGGFGMAGGMAVLGGIVAGPALAIGGAFMASKAEKALNDACSNMDMARKFEQEGKNICSTLNAIKARASQIDNLLDDLNERFDYEIDKLKNVIYFIGTDYRNYNEDARNTVMKSVQLAKTIKIVLDTSLLTEKGVLNDYETKQAIEKGQAALAILRHWE